MKPWLSDVSVLLPLRVRHHERHYEPYELALLWFNGLAAGEAFLCPFVQLARARLPGNRTIMGKYAASALAAWGPIARFIAEPALLDTILPKLLRYAGPTGKLMGDAYLAAFSIAGQMRLASLTLCNPHGFHPVSIQA